MKSALSQCAKEIQPKAFKENRNLEIKYDIELDQFASLISQVLQVPIVAISKLNEEGQFLISKIGIDVFNISSDISICKHVVESESLMLVPNLSKDPRFEKSPLVIGPPYAKFYLGLPLISISGEVVGTICAIDRSEKKVSDLQISLLNFIAKQLMVFLEYNSYKEGTLPTSDVTKENELKRELILSKERAEEANAIKTRFLANMSHEIRTPLNGILGMINMIPIEKLDEDTCNKIDIIKHCGDNLLYLINDILDFSKLEAGKLVLENSTANIDETIVNTINMILPTAEKKGLKVGFKKVGKQSSTNWFKYDQARLQQILLNLITNAIKFTPKGQVTVELEFEKVDLKKTNALISVADTGIGIDDAGKKRLFQSFSQVDGSTTRQFGGTGLGLAISKGIVQAMGGDIWVTSALGQGSKFQFRIPIENVEDTQSKKLTREMDFDSKMALQKPLNILVADDSFPNRIMAQTIFKNMGYSVDCVCNGLEVLDAFDNKHYDVIIMDCQMPEMDGFEATQKLRKRFTNEMAPWIIAYTASVFPEDKTKCLESGMDDFLTKPLDKQSLLECWNRIRRAGPNRESLRFEIDSNEDSNLKLMERNFSCDRDVMFMVIDQFVLNTPAALNALEKSIKNNDAHSVAVAAHKLRGVFGFFYATKSQELFLELEKMGREKELDGAASLFQNIYSRFNSLKDTLLHYKKAVG